MTPHVADRLSPYMDGELSAEDRTLVESHLRDCAECARHLSEFLAVDTLARDLPVGTPAGYFESFPARVRARVRAKVARRAWPLWSWAAAAALLLAVLTPLTLRDRQGEPRSPRVTEAPAALLKSKGQALPEQVQDKRNAPSPREGETHKSARLEEKDASSRLGERRAPLGPPTLTMTRTSPEASPPPPRDRTAGFAAPPPAAPAAGGVAGPATTAPEERDMFPASLPSKTESPVASREGQHGPRAQAQGVAQTPQAERRAAEDAVKAKPKPDGKERDESVRLDFPAAQERRAAAREKKEPPKSGGKSEEPEVGRRRAEPGVGDLQAGAASAQSEEAQYRSLSARSMDTVKAARELREAWRSFLRTHPESPWADEARVRAIEASALAWRLAGDPTDREDALREATAYLRRVDAQQKERVRAGLAEMTP